MARHTVVQPRLEGISRDARQLFSIGASRFEVPAGQIRRKQRFERNFRFRPDGQQPAAVLPDGGVLSLADAHRNKIDQRFFLRRITF